MFITWQFEFFPSWITGIQLKQGRIFWKIWLPSFILKLNALQKNWQNHHEFRLWLYWKTWPFFWIFDPNFLVVFHYPRSLNVSRTYFSRIALELSFRALYIWREGTTREIEKTTPVYVCINLYTNLWFVIIWLHFDFSDCLLLANSLIIWCSEILSDLGYFKRDNCWFPGILQQS